MSEEDLEPLVTTCPNCETRFKVTEAQLQAAKGQVRCGACLTVFDGAGALMLDGELVPQETEDVDVLLSEIDSMAATVEPFGEPELPVVEDSLEAQAVLALSDEDLSAAGEADRSMPPAVGAEVGLGGRARLPADITALEEQLMAELRGDGQASKPLFDESDLSTTLPQTMSTTTVDYPVADAHWDEWQSQSEEIIEALPAEEQTKAHDLGSEPEEAESEEVTEVTKEEVFIAPELLQEEQPKRSTFTWVLLVLALLALPVQVFWYQFDEWSKDDALRPIYAQACDLLGCELPVRRNVGLISARNSVLRDHPDVDDALIYDALLVNEASFEQPFPLVELTLTSLRGHLVASRRFKPSEYLGGEVTGLDIMPTRTPIHISLAIKDPGEAPLNFRVRFLPSS